MLHALEGAQRVADHRAGYARDHGHGRSGQRILQVVFAGYVDLVDPADGLAVGGRAEHDLALPHERAVLHLIAAGEPHDLRLCAFRHVPGHGIVPVENHEVICILHFKDALLEGDVLLHGAVAVQVILGDVEHRADVGMEQRGGLHHEGGNLAHGHVARLHLRHRAGIGCADVTHHVGALARVLEDLAQQRDRGGLAVGARDRQQHAGGLSVGVLDLAHDLHAQLLGAQHRGVLRGNAGADDQRVQTVDELLRLLFIEAQLCALRFDLVQRAVEGLVRLAVTGQHLPAPQKQQLRHGDAAARQAQYHRSLCHMQSPSISRKGRSRPRKPPCRPPQWIQY